MKNYKLKYLKYKNKYLTLKKIQELLSGGARFPSINEKIFEFFLKKT